MFFQKEETQFQYIVSKAINKKKKKKESNLSFKKEKEKKKEAAFKSIMFLK